MDAEDWATFTSKIIDQWWHLLEDNTNITHPCQWVGLYSNGEEDLVFVLQWSTQLTPSYLHQHHLTLPLPVNVLRLPLSVFVFPTQVLGLHSSLESFEVGHIHYA